MNNTNFSNFDFYPINQTNHFIPYPTETTAAPGLQTGNPGLISDTASQNPAQFAPILPVDLQPHSIGYTQNSIERSNITPPLSNANFQLTEPKEAGWGVQAPSELWNALCKICDPKITSPDILNFVSMWLGPNRDGFPIGIYVTSRNSSKPMAIDLKTSDFAERAAALFWMKTIYIYPITCHERLSNIYLVFEYVEKPGSEWIKKYRLNLQDIKDNLHQISNEFFNIISEKMADKIVETGQHSFVERSNSSAFPPSVLPVKKTKHFQSVNNQRGSLSERISVPSFPPQKAPVIDLTEPASTASSIIQTGRSLGTLLEQDPGLRIEAERLFKNFLSSIFDRKEDWANTLLEHGGIWRFNESFFKNFFTNFCGDYLEKKPENLKLVQAVLVEMILIFAHSEPVRMNFKKTTLVCQNPRCTYPNPLEKDLIGRLLKTWIKYKEIELQVSPLLPAERKPMTVPCVCIISAVDNAHVVFLNAHFDPLGRLEGFSMDRAGNGKRLLSNKHLLNHSESDLSTSESKISSDTINRLKLYLQGSEGNTRIPEFLIIGPLEEFHTVQSASLKSQPRKRKHAFSFDDTEEGVPVSRSTNHQGPQNSLEKMEQDDTGFVTIKDVLPEEKVELQWDSLWKQFSLQALDKTSKKIFGCSQPTRKKLKKQRLEFPLADSLALATVSPQQAVPFNPWLKGYQLEAAAKILRLFKYGISPLLAMEMGTGKTWVINEVLAQLSGFSPDASSIIVVPKSVCNQFEREANVYLSLVAARANLQKKSVDEKKFRDERFKQITRALKAKNVFQVIAWLPSIASCDFKEIYNIIYPCLPEEKNPFWNLLSAILLAQLKLVWGNQGDKFIESTRQKLADNCLTGERGSEEKWKTYFLKEPLDALVPGCHAEGLSFRQPILTGQLLFAGNVLKLCLETLGGLPKESLARLGSFAGVANVALNKSGGFVKALQEKEQVIVASYEVFKGVSIEHFDHTKVACLVFDEAQKIHKENTEGSKKCRERIESLKRVNPDLPVLLSTATPFENRVSELWTLLKSANPADAVLPRDLFKRVSEGIEKAQAILQQLAEGPHSESQIESCKRRFIRVFVEAEAFRSSISPLIERKKRNDPEVKRDWGGTCPERRDVQAEVKVGEVVKKKLDQAFKVYKKKGDQLNYSHQVNRILLHPDLADGSLELKADNMQKLFKKLNAPGNLSGFMQGSPRLSTLLNLPDFCAMIENKEKGLIFSEYEAESQIAKSAILMQYPKQVDVKLFSGSMKTEERNEVVRWFKTDASVSQVLILTKKAGGVGLNLPEASKIFRISDNWNPFVDAQAEDRANRINSAGLRTFVAMNFGTFHDCHVRAVREVKSAMEQFFLSKEIRILEQFQLFCQLILKQCYQAVLNYTKDSNQAIQKRKRIERELADRFSNFSEEQLNAALEEVKPVRRYPAALEPQSVKILPLSYRASFEDALKLAWLASVERECCLAWANKISRPEWREQLRSDLKGLPGSSGNEEAGTLTEIYNGISDLKQKALDQAPEIAEIINSHTLVFYQVHNGGYAIADIKNPGMKKSVYLYRKSTGKETHYDVMIL